MNDLSPGFGHNRGLTSIEALLELLREQTATLAEKAGELILCADERSEIVDEDSAGKAVQLEATMIELYADLDKLRAEIKKPYLEAGATIDAHFHTITQPLIGSTPAKKREGAVGDLHARIEAYDIAKRAEIDAERERLYQESLAQQAAADQAEREKADALARAHQTADPAEQAAAYSIAAAADAAARKARDEDIKARAAAAAQVARPIDSGVGPKASRRSNWVPQIIDLPAAVTHCLKIAQVRANLELVVLRAYGALVRGGARDSVDAAGNLMPGLPGARIIDQTKLQVRLR